MTCLAEGNGRRAGPQTLPQLDKPHLPYTSPVFNHPQWLLLRFHKTNKTKQNRAHYKLVKSGGKKNSNTQNNTRATRNTQDNRNTVESRVADSATTGRGLEGHLAEYIALETEKCVHLSKRFRMAQLGPVEAGVKVSRPLLVQKETALPEVSQLWGIGSLSVETTSTYKISLCLLSSVPWRQTPVQQSL